jgi:hypothetical protein
MADLKQLSAPELRNTIERMKQRGKSIVEKGRKPLIQGGMGLSAVAGGAAGGVVYGMKPSVARVPTDGALGLLIAVPCLMGAGSPAIDCLAMAGWGMTSGASSRVTGSATRDWREQRAADSGDAQATQIVALQKQLNELRKLRDEAPAKAEK